MSHHDDIDDILSDWPFEPGQVVARTTQAADGRPLVQMRLEMGLLQMEIAGRPDGDRPGGFDTYYDYLCDDRARDGDSFSLTEEQCDEADREFVQFYHRRMCWLTLRQFDKAVEDADHTLRFMDLVRDYAPSEEWALSHEQYRPFVLFHRTQAAALEELELSGVSSALDEIDTGLARLRMLFDEYDLEDRFEDDELVLRLEELKQAVRQQNDPDCSLEDQLNEAVALEDYEAAANIRDELTRRKM